MRRIVLGAAIGAVLAVSGAAAYATVIPNTTSWPAGCIRMRCVNNHLELLHLQVHSLSVQVAALRKRNRTLRACIAEYPVTRYNGNNTFYYGQDSNGDGNFDQNVYNDNPFRYLDQTNSGDSVGIWVLRDACSSPAYGRPPAP